MSRLSLCVLLIAVGLAALPAGAAPRPDRAPAASAPAADPQAFMGMVIHDPYYDFDTNAAFPGGANQAFEDKMGEILKAAGVRWVRLEFLSDESGPNYGHVDFAKYDYFIGTVAPRNNLKVLGLLGTRAIRHLTPEYDYYPKYLNIDPDNLSNQQYGFALNQYMIDWLDEALRIAAHYDGSNPQAGRVHAFEIFNEVNRLFGDGTNLDPRLKYAGLDPARVARIQAKFYRVCKNADGQHAPARCPADTQIIVGGLHPKGTSNPRTASQTETFAYTDEQYLQAMYQSAFADYKASIGGWPVDGVGYHPYPEEITPRFSAMGVFEDVYIKILPRIQQIRDTQLAAGDASPIWITEIGYNVGYYKVRGADAANQQASFMRELYTNLRQKDYIANVFWFKYEDFPRPCVNGKPVGDPQQWGIVHIGFDECSQTYDPSGEPAFIRPALLTYRELADLPIQRVNVPLGLR